MTHQRTDRPRVDWWSSAAWRLHAILVAGVALAAIAAWLEWDRALSGHQIAWAYSFEWPLFGLAGIYMWWRLLHQEVSRDPVAPPSSGRPVQAEPGVSTDDPDLVAWQAYLKRLHTADPPGGPPPARHSA